MSHSIFELLVVDWRQPKQNLTNQSTLKFVSNSLKKFQGDFSLKKIQSDFSQKLDDKVICFVAYSDSLQSTEERLCKVSLIGTLWNFFQTLKSFSKWQSHMCHSIYRLLVVDWRQPKQNWTNHSTLNFFQTLWKYFQSDFSPIINNKVTCFRNNLESS